MPKAIERSSRAGSPSNWALPKDEAVEIRRAVKRLVRLGRLRYASNHLVLPAAEGSGVGGQGSGGVSKAKDALTLTLSQGERGPRDGTLSQRVRGPRDGTLSQRVRGPRDGTLSQGERGPRDGTLSQGERGPRDGTASQREGRPRHDTLSPRERKTRNSGVSRTERGRGGRRVLGTFQRTQKGFGFVRLRDELTTGEKTEKDKKTDIYIPADRTGDAATGDVVLVEVGRGGRGDLGPRGTIVEVVERQTRQFVGTYLESAGAAYVPIDGTLFARPVYVGDPGAKTPGRTTKWSSRCCTSPRPSRTAKGVIAEVLGPRGEPGVDTLSIIREFGLPDRFADDALEEARHAADAFDESIGDRRDLTGETIVTIDPVDARDFDDAISLELLPEGHWRLGVHIADVSHFIRPDTALDREALERATSVYLPDRVLPMLPEVISNGLASLQPGKVRYTKSAIMEFTAEGCGSRQLCTRRPSAAASG